MTTNQSPLRVVLPPSCHDEMRQVWVSNLLLWHSTMASTSSTSSTLSSSSITIKDDQEENYNNNATNKAAAVPSRSMTSNNPSLLEAVWKQQTRAWLKTTLLVQQQQQQQQQQQLLLHQQQQEPKDGRPTGQDAPNNAERDDETWVDKVVDQIAQEAHVIVESQLQQQQSLIMRISSKERSTMDATGAPVVVSDSTPTTKKSSSSSSFSLFSSGSLFAVGGLNSSSMFVWPVEQEKHADNPSQLLQSLQTKVRFLDDVVLTDDWTDIGAFLQHALKETANAVDAMTTTDPRPRPSVVAMAARDIHQDWYGKLRTMQPRQHYALALMDLCYNVFVAAAANSNSESNNNTTMDEKDHDDDDDKKEWGDGLIQLWWTMWMDFWTIHSSSNPNNNSIGNNGEVQNKAWTMVQRLWPNNNSNNNQSDKNGSVLPDGVWKFDPTATWFRVWRMSQRRKKPPLSTTNHPTTTTTTTTTIASTSNKDQHKNNENGPDWDQWLFVSHACHELFSIPPPTTTGASIHFHTDKPPLNLTQRRLLILLTQWLIVHRSFQFPWNHALSSLSLLRTSAPEKNHNGKEVEKDDKNNTQFMLDRQGEVRVMFVERLLQLMVTTMAYSSSAATNTATTAAHAQDDVLMDKNNSIDDRQEAMESLCWQGLETLLAHAKQEQSQPNVTGRTTYARMQAKLAKYGRPTSLAEGRERNAGVIRGMGAKESRCNNDSSSITIAILRQQIVSDHWPEDTSSDATT